MRKAALATVGCKVNQYETQVIRERLEKAGYTIVPFSSFAQAYIINTCTVTGRADQKSIYLARKALKKNSSAKILVTGCMVEADGGRIKQKVPRARIVKNVDKLKIDTFLPSQGSVSHDFTIHSFFGHQRAFVKIEDGCNQLCSYCKVPYVRGRKIRSRYPEEIISEVRGLCRASYREIVLTGVNVALYGKDLSPTLSLVNLLERIVSQVSDGTRIRLSSLEPHLIPEGLLDLMASTSCICSHLHLPVQSGDDKVLKKMGRGYTCSQIKNLVEGFREKLPDLGVTGDVIVGFPGEGEDNFHNTLDFIKKLMIHRLHVFPFSPRPEVPASRMRPKVPGRVKKKRSKILKKLSWQLCGEFISKFIGETLPVLVESKQDRETGYFTGYTHNYIKVVIFPESSDVQKLVGKIVPVKIVQAKPRYALGKIK